MRTLLDVNAVVVPLDRDVQLHDSEWREPWARFVGFGTVPQTSSGASRRVRLERRATTSRSNNDDHYAEESDSSHLDDLSAEGATARIAGLRSVALCWKGDAQPFGACVTLM